MAAGIANLQETKVPSAAQVTLASLKTSLHLHPTSNAAFKSAQVLLDSHKHNLAIENYGLTFKRLSKATSLIIRQPKSNERFKMLGNAYYARGIMESKFGEYEDFALNIYTRAIDAYTQAIYFFTKYSPKNDAERKEMDEKLMDAFCRRGFAELQLENHSNAAADYCRALGISPGSAAPFNGLGFVERMHAKFIEEKEPVQAKEYYTMAIKNFSEAIKLKPDFVEAFRNRSACYKALGMEKDADLDTKTVLELLTKH